MPRQPGRSWRATTARIGAATSAAVVAALMVPLAPAQASLADVGPVAANGYPSYYEDSSGLRLRLCDDPADGCTLAEVPDPNSPVTFPGNYPGESFYFAAASADASYEAALEAAFSGEEAATGENMVFSRIRIRLDGLVAGETYLITHPYGVLNLEAEPVPDGTGRINHTDDQGCVGPPCGDFRSTLPLFVGDQSATSMNFLTRVGFDAATAAPGDEIGDPVTPTAVTGSPFETNFFRVEGPNAGGPGVDVLTENTFTIEGQVAAPPEPNRPSTPDLDAASDTGRVDTDNITNDTTPTFSGTAVAGSQLELLVGTQVAATGTATAEGTYSLTPTTPLTAGTPRISVRALPADPAGTPSTSGALNIQIDTAAPVATIDNPRPTNGNIDNTPTLNFSAAEARSAFECRLERGTEIAEDWVPCVSPRTYDEQPTNARYTFKVRATDPAGNLGPEASYSWNIGTVVAAPGAPGTPTATAGAASATVRWTAPTTGGAVASYTVRAYEGTGTTVVTTVDAGTALNATVTGLTNGTAYTFDVVASNAGGSATSQRSTAVTPQPAPVVPNAPTGVTATAGNASATVSWTAPTNTTVATYELQVRRGTMQVGSIRTGLAATPTSTTVTGLTNGTAYNFRVRARNAAGVSGWSTASANVTPRATTTTVPSTPTGVTATAGNASANVSWTASSNVTTYEVQVRNGTAQVGSIRTGLAATPTSTTVTGLTNGTAYNFRVRARNAAGASAWSTASNTVTPTAGGGGGGTDTTAPTWTARTPGNRATGRPRNTNVTVTFSEAVQGVTGTTFTLKNTSTGASVAAVVSRDGTTNRWILNPNTNLAASTNYTATVTGGTSAVRDMANNPFTTMSWSFTTGAT